MIYELDNNLSGFVCCVCDAVIARDGSCACCDAEYEPDELECEECGHAVGLHGDKYGCQFEPGDTLDGSKAKPPCGCQAITVEPEHHGQETVMQWIRCGAPRLGRPTVAESLSAQAKLLEDFVLNRRVK